MQLNKEYFLTIAIPTFNRSSALIDRINELAESGLGEEVEVVIIDNASIDDSYVLASECIDALSNKSQFRLMKNTSNIGYHGNFNKLFEVCRGEYIFVMSDEDALVSENLQSLINLLKDRKPVLVSPQALLLNGAHYRGKKITQKIESRDFRNAVNYVAGTTFQVTPSIEALLKISRLFDDNSMACLYPQVLLSASLLAKGEGFWLKEALTEKKANLKSYITDTAKKVSSPYTHLDPRWEQVKDLLSFLTELQDGLSKDSEKSKVQDMIEKSSEELFYWIQFGLSKERPELLSYFNNGAIKRLSIITENQGADEVQGLKIELKNLKNKLVKQSELVDFMIKNNDQALQLWKKCDFIR